MRSQLSKCRLCAYYQLGNQLCRIFNETFSPEEPGCPHYSKIEYKCNSCGKPIVDTKSMFCEVFNDQTFILCDACNSQVNSCAFCSEAGNCDFNTNPINLPKVVQQQVRQGYTIMTTQIKNPARVAETCAKNCKCWDPINQTCNKEGEVKWCESYDRKH